MNIIILGAAGRDFHNFNVVYRTDPTTRIVAFTAAQIPGIGVRRYPSSLAGPLYPEGIPIADESELETLCRRHKVDQVVFAYSDVPHAHVMNLASRALAVGTDFILLGPNRTMLPSSVPVIAITGVRTGCGKSAIARWLGRHLRGRGWRVAILRHPMPYRDFSLQRVQRFASIADIDAAKCTVEEREEYEPHIAMGNVVFAGIDYAAILRVAEAEAEIIVWDGGNNDFPFIRPNLSVTAIDALRPKQIDTHHPGETVARMADIFVVNKVDSANVADIRIAEAKLREINPAARIVHAGSSIRLENEAVIKDKRVLAIDDGPTITHGGMSYGAAYIAAVAAGAVVVDPRPSAALTFRRIFAAYPHVGKVLPAVGYNPEQLGDLEKTINSSDAEIVVSGTPVDLARLLRINKPIFRARYDYVEVGEPRLSTFVDDFLDGIRKVGSG